MNNKMISIGWEAFITGSQKELLPSMAWKVDLFGQGQRQLNLRAKVPDWKERTWADQTFLQAAYGFRKDGAIVLTLEDVRKDSILEPLLHGARRETPHGAYPEPGWPLPGADTRIRMHLKEHTCWEWMNTKNDTVAWMGPDGSIILTCPGGMGGSCRGFRASGLPRSRSGSNPILRVGREGKNLRLATGPRPTAPVGHIASDAAKGRTTAPGKGMAGRPGHPVPRDHPHQAPP